MTPTSILIVPLDATTLLREISPFADIAEFIGLIFRFRHAPTVIRRWLLQTYAAHLSSLPVFFSFLLNPLILCAPDAVLVPRQSPSFY